MKAIDRIYTLPALVALLGLSTALYWGLNVSKQNEDAIQAEFDLLSKRIIEQFYERMELYKRGLLAERGAILAAGGEIATRSQFKAYTDSRNIEKEYPGARGIGFIRKVPAKQEQAYTARMQREGVPDFQIHHLEEHDGEHFVIEIIEPIKLNRQALGLDIASEANRRNAAIQASKTGEAGLTAPITLVQATGKVKQGFLLLLPVQRPLQAGASAEEKYAATYGWVYSPLVISEVLGNLKEENLITLQLSDVTDGRRETFYTSDHKAQPLLPRMDKQVRLNFYGREWLVDITADAPFIPRMNLGNPWFLAGELILIFLLLAVMLYTHLRRLQLNVQQQYSGQIGDAAPEAMLVVDRHGAIVYANQKLSTLFGYEMDELIGRKMEFLMPERYRQRHQDDRAHYNQIPRTVGRGRYLMALHKDGSEFPVEVSLGPLMEGDQRRVIAVVVDITVRKQMEDALRESEARWKLALEGSGDSVWDWNLGTGQVSLSQGGAEMFGYELAEAGVRNISDWYALMLPEDQQLWKEMLRSFFAGKEERFSIEYRVRCRDGRYKWILTRGMVVERGRDGRVMRMIGVHTDINDRKNAEVALAKSEERFRETLNQAPALVWIADQENRGIWYSRRWLEYTGRTMEQELGLGWIEGMHPDDRERCAGICQIAFDNRRSFEMEMRLRKADGSYGWIADTGIPRFNAQGDFDGYIGYCWDITDRKLAEQALQESERKFRTLSENIPGMLYRGDSNWRVEYISNCELLCGYTASELQGGKTTWLQLIHPDDRERVLKDSAELTVKPCAMIQEYRIQSKDGKVRWMSDHKQSIFNEAGSFVGVDGVVFDITDRKRAEQEVALSKERLRRGQMFANIGTWDWNIVTGTLFWSERIAPLFGYPAGNLETSYDNFLAAIHPDDRRCVIDAVNASVERDVPYEIEHRVVWPDGTVRWLSERGAVVRDATGKALQMLGVVQDIHERKMAQEELKDSKERFSFAVEGAGDGIWDWDILTGAMPLSGHYEEMLGYRKGDLEPTIEAWVKSVHPDDLPRAQANLKEYLEGMMSAYTIELRLHCKDGSYKWILCRGTVVERDKDGNPTRMIGIHTDIHQRKMMEAELLEARHAAESANRAKSEFLSSMSHELRTPLNAVLGFGQLLEADKALDAGQQDSVKEIIKAGRHLLELVNEVLDLAKIESGRIDLSLEPVALEELVMECRSLVKPLAEMRGISIECANCGDAHVRADRVRLKQVLLNLLSNAVKYNRDGGSITLSRLPGREGYLRMAVSDTGKGIPAERMDELFQPFHRLEAENSAIEGTGIGLTITRRLVEMMGGSIGVESVPGKGSTFWIEFPETSGEFAHAHIAAGDSDGHAAASGSHTVLYIEDNPVNIKLVSQILARRSNIRLLTAHEPGLGIELAKAHRPGLVLLDINLPGMDGYQVLKIMQAKTELADIPVVAVTANALPRDIERGKQAGFTDYLTKPLDVESFLQVIDNILIESNQRSNARG